MNPQSMAGKDPSSRLKERLEYFRKHVSEFDTHAFETFLSILCTGDMMRSVVDHRMRKYGLTGPAFGILTMLESAPGKKLCMNMIGCQFSATQANITGLVDTLEKKGYVSRNLDPADRRIRMVEITRKGTGIINKIFPIHSKFIETKYKVFSRKEKNLLMELLQRLRKELSKESLKILLFLIFIFGSGIPARAGIKELLMPKATDLQVLRQQREEPAFDSQPSSYTLMDCYQAALKLSEKLQILSEHVEQARSQVQQAWGALKPHLTLSGSEFFQDTSGTGGDSGSVTSSLNRGIQPVVKMTLRQPLFSGFREFSALDSLQVLEKQQVLTYKRNEKTLFLDVAKVFYNVILLQTNIENTDAIISLTKDRIQDLNKRVELGKSRESELLTTESQLASLEASREKNVGDLSVAREAFGFLTGLSTSVALRDDLQNSEPRGTLEDYVQKGRSRTDILALEDQVAISQDNLKSVKANLYPVSSLLGNYYFKRVGFQEHIDWDILLSLDIPIYQGGQAKGQVLQALSQLRESEFGLKLALRSVDSEIRTNYLALRSSLDQLEHLSTALTKEEESYQLELREYRLGLVNNLDILQALNTLQGNRINLDTGRLLAKLDLIQLKVSTEDLP